jgi:micrococcal nuclease
MKYILQFTIIGIGIVIIGFPQQIFARQISQFPNGSLIRSVSGTQVYYIDQGKKRYISSPNMLTSQFRWQDVIVTSPVEIDAISEGSAMTYAEGSLLSNRGVVYVVSETKVRPIASPEVFIAKGYKWSNIIAVSDTELGVHQRGVILSSSDSYPNGSLLITPGGRVYRIKDNKKQYIPSPTIFDAKYRWDFVIPVSQNSIDNYEQGPNEYYPEGTLISSTTGVFIVQNNTRQAIISPAIFESYRFQWNNIRRATDYELSLIPEGNAFDKVKAYRSRVLISADNSPDIYVLDEMGLLRYIPSPFIFNHRQYKWQEVIKISSNAFNKYQKGSNILFRDGTPVSYNGAVYLIANGFKRPIASPEIFLGLGYSWNQVIPLRDYEFAQYPMGSIISNINADFYNAIIINDGDDMVINMNGKIEGVKLLGIDAPDDENFSYKDTCFGIEAHQALKNIIDNNRVKLIKDPNKEDRDNNNRLLRYVILENGNSIQEYLLSEGYVREYTYQGEFYEKQSQYKLLEQQAKLAQKGLWSSNTCNSN